MSVPSRVLVVDDNPAVCELIQEILSSAEMEAFTLTDSSLAAGHLAREKFDAVFLDKCMPSASQDPEPSVIKVSWLSVQNGAKRIRTNQDADSVKG
jgi:CheY-like chemotaxis protein